MTTATTSGCQPARIPNTFGLDVVADSFHDYSSAEELQHLIGSGLIAPRHLHVGSGSNLLFLSPHYHGTVLHSRICGVSVVGGSGDEVLVRVGAGCVWDDFVAFCVVNGWQGVENLSLIPGEVGASAVQNIGAYGVEVKDVISRVEAVDMQGRSLAFDVSECGYGYRDSIFKRPHMKDVFITHVTYRLSRRGSLQLGYKAIRQALEGRSVITLSDVRQAVIGIRRAKLPDPAELGSAGSFFKNPVVSAAQKDSLLRSHPSMPFYQQADGSAKIPAGWLIEQCGWKGRQLGPAAVYGKQALVIVNTGGATGSDIMRLAEAVQHDVLTAFGLPLSPEVNIIE